MDINVSEIALVHQTDGRCIPMITCECGNLVHMSDALFEGASVVCASCGRTIHLKSAGEKPVDKDVTALVDFFLNDDKCLPIISCVCGEKFAPWDFMISVYREDAKTCPKCKRKLYFTNNIRVFEVING